MFLKEINCQEKTGLKLIGFLQVNQFWGNLLLYFKITTNICSKVLKITKFCYVSLNMYK